MPHASGSASRPTPRPSRTLHGTTQVPLGAFSDGSYSLRRSLNVAQNLSHLADDQPHTTAFPPTQILSRGHAFSQPTAPMLSTQAMGNYPQQFMAQHPNSRNLPTNGETRDVADQLEVEGANTFQQARTQGRISHHSLSVQAHHASHRHSPASVSDSDSDDMDQDGSDLGYEDGPLSAPAASDPRRGYSQVTSRDSLQGEARYQQRAPAQPRSYDTRGQPEVHQQGIAQPAPLQQHSQYPLRPRRQPHGPSQQLPSHYIPNQRQYQPSVDYPSQAQHQYQTPPLSQPLYLSHPQRFPLEQVAPIQTSRQQPYYSSPQSLPSHPPRPQQQQQQQQHHHHHQSHQSAEGQQRPAFQSQPVYQLACAACIRPLCLRAMKAVMLSDHSKELYSTDMPPAGLQLVNEDRQVRHCACRIRDSACLGCGQVAGYHVTQPCSDCLKDQNNGHFWMFYSTAVFHYKRNLGNGADRNVMIWANVPSISHDQSLAQQLRLEVPLLDIQAARAPRRPASGSAQDGVEDDRPLTACVEMEEWLKSPVVEVICR